MRARRAEDDLAAYRRLAIQLHTDLAGGHNSVLVVSPDLPDVPARSSLVLACCVADELPGRVLLIDACKRDPVATRLLGASGLPGLANLMADGGAAWAPMILPTSHDRLDFLPAGNPGVHGPGTRDISELLALLARDRSLVLISGGSVLNESASASLAPHVGCALLSVVEDQMRVSDLEAAQQTLLLSRPRKLGILMTTATRTVIPKLGARPSSPG